MCVRRDARVSTPTHKTNKNAPDPLYFLSSDLCRSPGDCPSCNSLPFRGWSNLSASVAITAVLGAYAGKFLTVQAATQQHQEAGTSSQSVGSAGCLEELRRPGLPKAPFQKKLFEKPLNLNAHVVALHACQKIQNVASINSKSSLGDKKVYDKRCTETAEHAMNGGRVQRVGVCLGPRQNQPSYGVSFHDDLLAVALRLLLA